MSTDDENGMPGIVARVGHCRYGYETEAGDRFTLWDTRSAGGYVPYAVHSPSGDVGQLGARTDPVPGYWRRLRVGDRVFVDMTPAAARALAVDRIDRADAATLGLLERRFASRDDAIQGFAAELMKCGAPAVQTVTRGLLDAFAAAPPDGDTPPVEADTDTDAAGTIHVEIHALAITYRSRTGDQLTEQQWDRMTDDPAYAVLERDVCRLIGVDELAMEVQTIWTGIVVNGDASRVFNTACRVVHLCDRPDCNTGPFNVVANRSTEAEARQTHAKMTAAVRADTTGSGRSAMHKLLELMRVDGDGHLNEEIARKVGAAASSARERRGQA